MTENNTLASNEHDPWGNPRSNSGDNKRPPASNNNAPPDLDELVEKWREGLGGILNKGSKGQSGGSRGRGRVPMGKKSGSWISLAVLAIALIFWAANGFYIINEQERGVVLRLGKYHSTLEPGLRWQPYIVDTVTVVNTTRVRSLDTRALMLTEDENIVDVALQVQYVVQSAPDFYLNVRSPENSLKEATDSALRHVVGGTGMDQIITEGRADVAAEVKRRLQFYLDNYATGILVSQVNIQRADPPNEVKPAFEDVISAREDEVRFTNQATAYANRVIPEARGQAQRITEEAQGYRARVVARAEGEADRFTKLLEEYLQAPEVTKKRLYLEVMEEVLANSSKVVVDVENGNNIMYLPLDRMLAQRGINSADDLATNDLINDSNFVNRLADQVLQQLGTRNQRSTTTTRR